MRNGKEKLFCPLCNQRIVLRVLKLENGKQVSAYNDAYAHLVSHLLYVQRNHNLKESDWELPLESQPC
mgnify:FL=1